MGKFFKSSLLKVFVAAFAFIAVSFFIDFGELWLALAGLSLFNIFLLLLISVVLIYISVLKWHLFLESQRTRESSKVSVFRLFCYYLIGCFVNLIFPSYLGGDVVRSLYAGNHSSKTQAFVATVLERYTGLIAMVSLALLFIWLAPGVTWQMKLGIILLGVATVFLTILAASSKIEFLLRLVKLPERFVVKLVNFQQALLYIKEHKLLCLKAMLLSYLFHLVAVINVYVAGIAVGWINVPFDELFVALPPILLIGALPVSPNGLGIQEGTYVYFLSGLGATATQAFGLALVLRTKSYLVALVGGLVWLFFKRFDKKVADVVEEIENECS